MKAAYEHISPSDGGSFRLEIRREAQFQFAWHVHPEFELTLITEGTGQRFIGDSVRSYAPGDLVLVGAHLPHTWRSLSGGPSEAVVVQFRRDFLGVPLWEAPEFTGVAKLLDGAGRGLEFTNDLARQIRDLAAVTDPARRTVGLLDVLVQLAEAGGATVASAGFSPVLREDARRRIDDVYNYLYARYADHITLAEVAAVAHLTPAAFSRFFHRTTGHTLTDFIAELRVGAVRRMLVETDEPVTAIASACGFRNLSHFNRTFRRLSGTSPREYRQSYRPDGGLDSN